MEIIVAAKALVGELAFLKSCITDVGDPIALSTDRDSVVLTASSPRYFLQTRVPATVRSGGGTITLGRTLVAIASQVDGDIALSTGDDNRLHIRAGDFSAIINRSGKQPYEREVIVDPVRWSIPADLLKLLIRKTSLALPDETQMLPGALLQLTDTHTRLVATDGHRLNVAVSPKVLSGRASIMVPSKTLLHIGALLETNFDGDVSITHDATHIVVEAGARILRGTLLEKSFPDFERIIPTTFKRELVVKREALERAVKRTTLMGQLEPKAVILSATGTSELTIEAFNEKTDAKGKRKLTEATETIDMKSGDGEPFRIKVNSDYVKDSLESADTDEVRLLLVDAKNPIVVSPVTADDHNVTVLIMPMSLVTPDKAAA
jgi:DNA polymerase-3 subunit beta